MRRFSKREESFCGVEWGEQVWDRVIRPKKIPTFLELRGQHWPSQEFKEVTVVSA